MPVFRESRRRRAAALALIAAGAAGAAPLAGQRSGPSAKEVDAVVERALREFGQPGLAVAVVEDGRVVLAKGYGVRRMGDPAQVDAHTRFQIASNTKAYTTAALAMLVDAGTLSWDDRVTKWLPWFELSDPYVTREFTLRDLLTHRSGLGLGAGDLLWWHSTYDREEVVRRLRTLPLETSFRSAYAYDNVLYVAAGLVVEAASGTSWDDFVRTRIFEPLGMTEAATSLTAFGADANLAAPHGLVDGKLAVVPPDTVDNTGPAGSLVMSVVDAAKWMTVQLDSGRVAGGRRLWSAARTREMWSGQLVLPIGDPPPSLAPRRPNFSEYGLGWFLQDYRGRKIVTHTGGLSGMVSRTLLVPGERLGIVVLTNGETLAMEAVAWQLVDAWLGAPKHDWTAAYREAAGRSSGRVDSVLAAREAARAKDSKPSLPLERYAGRYTDPMYGDMTIALEDGTPVMRFGASPAFVGDLEHWQHDTFVARWRQRNLADAYVTFHLKPDGSIDGIRMEAFRPDADFSFDYHDLRFRPAPANGAGR
jgi:CubicO group peptidase (beta-lactamase class C family)